MGVHIPLSLSRRSDRLPHDVKERERTSALAAERVLCLASHTKNGRNLVCGGGGRNVPFFVTPREIE